MEHDLSVTYAEETLSGDSIDLSSWDTWTYEDNGVRDYFVKGPCPSCHASVQGSYRDTLKPIEAQGPDEELHVEASERVEVPVVCHCGAGHGEADKTSCGRSWSLIVSRVSS